LHNDSSDNLLANEVSVYLVSTSSFFPCRPKPKLPNSKQSTQNIPDLHLKQTSLVVLLDVHVDGEMCVDISHLVLETLRDTDDQVVDERSDCAEGGDVLSGTVVQLDLDDILLGMREVDCQVVEVLGELACSLSVRIPSCLHMLPICCVPRGPSTVTSRDLMVTLTIRGQQVSNCPSFNAPARIVCGR
jgi:hypothetical protein